jgi:hypothetical protein
LSTSHGEDVGVGLWEAGDEIEGKKTKRQAENQVDGSSKEIQFMEKRRKKWTQVQQDREWEDRDRWRFLCNSRPKELETT